MESTDRDREHPPPHGANDVKAVGGVWSTRQLRISHPIRGCRVEVHADVRHVNGGETLESPVRLKRSRANLFAADLGRLRESARLELLG